MKLLLAPMLALLLAAPAQAASWKRFTNLAGPPVSAGKDLVIAGYGAHGVAVLGPSGVTRTFNFGPGCRFDQAAGGGRAIADCGPSMKKINLTTGSVATYPAVPADPGDFGPAPVKVGSRWLSLRYQGYHWTATGYLNLRTGERRFEADLGAAEHADLDAPGLSQPLCAPVKRPRNPQDPYNETEPFGPVTVSGRNVVFARYDENAAGAELLAWRCGHARPQRLAECGNCNLYAVSGDRVVWATAYGLRTVNLRTGRRSRLSGPKGTGTFTGIATDGAGRFYVSLIDGSVSTTRLPR